jgi:TolB-like protein
VLGLAASAVAQEEAQPAPERYSVAVFLFADQTYHGAMGSLEAGLRDIISQTLALQPRLDVVDPERLDRAIRRAGSNPTRPIPYGQALRIASDLGVSRSVSGSLTEIGGGVRIEVQMVYVADPSYVWTISRTVPPDTSEAEAAGVDLAREMMRLCPVDDSAIAPKFWLGARAHIRVRSNSDRVGLALVTPPEEARLDLASFRVTQGKTLGTVAWDSEHERLAAATASGTARADWEIELSGVMSGPASQLRFSVQASPGATVEIEVFNDNLLGQSRSVKSYRMAADTPSADLLVDGDALRKDGPLYVVKRDFGALEGSIALCAPATS